MPERNYEVIEIKEGTFGVQISSPQQQDAPLIISGFSSEAEALAWIEGERNRTATTEGDW